MYRYISICIYEIAVYGRSQRCNALSAAGAGDRLGLQCEHSGKSVPTAMLPYCGRTLLEGLVRDLQASICQLLLKCFRAKEPKEQAGSFLKRC